MDKQTAAEIVTAHLKPIFGFALKRCSDVHDAEDLSQEIVMRVYSALIKRDDIEDAAKYIWAAAHNCLANYYRDKTRFVIGTPIDELGELLHDESDFTQDIELKETVGRMRREIAYLSKIQRHVVIAYYFENKKQEEIAHELSVPLGTVKWHLFEAKKELRKGMELQRNSSELKFNPIKFSSCGINGSVGTVPPDSFFRTALSQNIAYCVRHREKSVNEIADDLGVSPVYVENEIEYLEEYGFLLRRGDKYIVNFLIYEPTEKQLLMKDEMYKKAAKLFAYELFDRLCDSGILRDSRIVCSQQDDPVSLTHNALRDDNYILWTLIPFIAARSGERMIDEKISFDEAATLRPDGGHNICQATVENKNIVLPDDFVCMRDFCGPYWIGDDSFALWSLDTEWSGRRMSVEKAFSDEIRRVLSLFKNELDGPLSKDDYTWLSERGFVKTNGDYNGNFKSGWQVVWLSDREITNELLLIGEKIKEKHIDDFESLKVPYAKLLVESFPEHLRKMKEYENQFIFHSDGWFLLHCLNELVKCGRLKLPTDNQKRSMSTVIFPNK